MRRPLSALLLALGLSSAQAQSLPAGFTLDADGETSYELATGEAIFPGNARLTYGNALLVADEIRYQARTQSATARGNVSLTMGTRRLVADEVVYHLSTRSYSVKALRFGDNVLTLSGTSVVGQPEDLIFTDAQLTYGEPGRWAPTLRAARVEYLPRRERITFTRARLGLGLWQPLPLPSGEIPTDLSLLSYLTATGGYSSRLGAYAGLGVHLPVAPGVKLGGDFTYYTARGLLSGPSGSYRFGDADRRATGAFRSGFIHDNGEKLTDILGRPIQEDRGFVEWEHRQQVAEHLTLTGQVNYWSDSDVLRDFRPEYFFPVQTPDTFLELVHTSDNAVLSAFARAQPNRYHRVQQRLPEIRYDLLPMSIGKGIYQRFNGSLALLREDPPGATLPTLKSDRIDAYYALTRPFTPREWLSIKPVAGGRLTHYARALGGKDDYTRALGEVGLDADLRLSGLYDYRNERWKIDGIRHLVTPRLSYRYIPKADKGRAYIPAIDDEVFTTYLQPLGLGDRRNLDRLGATNTLRMEIDNTFQTRDPKYGSRDLLRVNFAGDWRFEREEDERDFSDLHTELAFTPAPWLEFDLYQSYSTQDWRLRELNTGVTLRDANAWSVRFSSHYLNSEADLHPVYRGIQEYVIDHRYRLNEVYETIARLHFDAKQTRLIEQTYGVRQNLDNRWIVRYELAFYEGPRRESAFGFNVQIETATF